MSAAAFDAAAMPSLAGPSLEVRGLSKAFGGVQAVNDVSFAVAEGELLALIGPNGAGKSTCFNMLNGQIRPDRGSVTLAGEELVGLTPPEIWRRGVGRTFQITATFASMTVAENVAMVLMSGRRELFSFTRSAVNRHREEALALLEMVGMAAQADRPCGVLAYGDLKRVELAVALASEPRVLLMDEPTAGMAPRERVALMGLAARLAHERRVAVLFTEHDMDIVFGHADRIIVLSRGALIAEGNAEQIRKDPLVLKTYLGEGHVYGQGGRR
jgi:branched-chain amino acid transport system ATP-binding protein